MQHFSASPKEMLTSLWRHRDLISASAKREVLGRYRGSIMGLLWPIVIPIFMLAIYTFVFSVVFKARWGEGGGSKTEFALMLFAGLIVSGSLCRVHHPCARVDIGQRQIMSKKVVFPLEILPVVGLLLRPVSLRHQSCGMASGVCGPVRHTPYHCTLFAADRLALHDVHHGPELGIGFSGGLSA